MITIFIRTVVLYLLIVVSLRIMGKRQIGELEPSELVVAVLISELSAIPMQDIRIPLIIGVLPVLTLLSMELLLSVFIMKSPKFRTVLCGRPNIIVANGVPVQSAMRKNRLTLDELMEELRGKGVFDIKTVKYAILETGGKLSILLYENQQPATPLQLGVECSSGGLWTIIINDGRVLDNNLALKGLDRAWLDKQIKKNGFIDSQEVFLLSVDEQNTPFFIRKV